MSAEEAPGVLTCTAVAGIGEVTAGDDLATLLTDRVTLRDGDVVVVTSKVVSKAEGRVVTAEKPTALEQETDRVVARRGPTTIVRTRLGLVMAAAGIDASNTAPGTLVLLPEDPDRSARRLRAAFLAGRDGAGGRGVNVAVLVSDTSGRAWRAGQTDIAVGAAGLEVLRDHAGLDDGYGNRLAVTSPAVADEITAAADLVTGKLSRSPVAVVRGLSHLVLPPGVHGPGAAALVRPEDSDMFGLGAREAVRAALTRGDGRGFGAPVSAAELAEALRDLLGTDPATEVTCDGEDAVVVSGQDLSAAPALAERVAVLAFASGWRVRPQTAPPDGGARLRITRAGP